MRRYTEHDWLRPLIMVRELAAAHGLLLTDEEEQQLVHDMVEAMTHSLVDELAERTQRQAQTVGQA